MDRAPCSVIAATLAGMDGIDVGLSAHTYEIWKVVLTDLGLDWDALSSTEGEPGSIWAWGREEVVERFHPSILRRLAERALAAGAPLGTGDAWVAAGGAQPHWLELDDLLRTLRGHREIQECALLVRRNG